jgi:hypothetical protein
MHNLLLMIAHGTKHHWCKLRWILDLVWYFKSDKINLQTINDANAICGSIGMQKAFKVALILSSRFIDENHFLHDWLKSQTSNTECRLADSLIFDLARKRKQNIKEKTKNIYRSMLMQDKLMGSLSYLLNRIVGKFSKIS